MGGVASSLSHTFRERETPNANPDRANKNQFLGAKSTDESMGKLRDLLPEKRRKDAVVTIEYLITTSPEWSEQASPKEQAEFFNRSLDWLREKHGKENVFTVAVHGDETTPHLVAYVAPNTKDGRLCAKDFLGGPQKLSAMQTDFANHVQDLGLERGIEGSRAKHQRVKKHYALVNKQPEQAKWGFQPNELKKKFTESQIEYTNRINEEIVNTARARIDPIRAIANESITAKKRANEYRDTADRLKGQAELGRKLTNGLTPTQLQQLENACNRLREENQEKRQEQKLDQKRSRGPSLT